MKIDGPYFKDESGRTLLLRGVNLGGSSKMPTSPDGATYHQEGFFDHRNVSFVNRPFALDEAEEHFARLKSWGYNFLRFLVTWEAIEHLGPGQYDMEYIAYVHSVLEIAAKYGINVFIDPHQDMWSRFSGGDGAPGWTFDLIGLDIEKFQATGAAFTHQAHGDPLPRMIWPTNATKLATATMFTLFFGGKDFAPLTKVEGFSIQDFLQDHYIRAINKLAEALTDLPNVVGYDSMNEPVEGWIGIQDLNKRSAFFEKGFIPTPFQAMQLGCGIPIRLESWERGVMGARVVGRKIFNSEGLLVWKDGFDPVWQRNGVWRLIRNKPVLLQPNHFAFNQGRQVNFNRDYYVPFNNRFADALRQIEPKTMIFIEKGFGLDQPMWGPEDARNVVYAPHWYDPVVLLKKSFNKWINYDQLKQRLIVGSRNIRKSFREQLSDPKHHARDWMGNIPVLIGEVGIAFDLDGKQAYVTNDFSAQEKALDRTLDALDANLLHYTLWNYTSDNTNLRGDHWNDEDLSIFSRDQQTDPADLNSGGRALQALLRPYPVATGGEPLELSFDYKTKEFIYRYRHQSKIEAPTIIYLPAIQYPAGCLVEISDGRFELDEDRQQLNYWHDEQRSEHQISIRPLKHVFS